MAGPAGADDPLEQARAAQIPAHARMAPWFRYAVAPGLGLPPPPPMAATAPPAAQMQASPGGGPVQAGSNGTAAAGGEAKHGTGPKPVPPTLAPGQRDAALSKARALNSERKEVRDQLRQGSLSLAQALAQDGEAAHGMRVVTVVRALSGIGAATARRLMREAGIDPGRRAGALNAGQRERLVAAVNADLAARHGHRVTIPASPPAGSAGSTRHRKH